MEPQQSQKFRFTRLCRYGHLCNRGTRCTYAHDSEQIQPVVNLDKTRICRKRDRCPKKETCRFAHHLKEIRSTTDVYKLMACVKTSACNFYLCRHAHVAYERLYLEYLLDINPESILEEGCIVHYRFLTQFISFQRELSSSSDFDKTNQNSQARELIKRKRQAYDNNQTMPHSTFTDGSSSPLPPPTPPAKLTVCQADPESSSSPLESDTTDPSDSNCVPLPPFQSSIQPENQHQHMTVLPTLSQPDASSQIATALELPPIYMQFGIPPVTGTGGGMPYYSLYHQNCAFTGMLPGFTPSSLATSSSSCQPTMASIPLYSSGYEVQAHTDAFYPPISYHATPASWY